MGRRGRMDRRGTKPQNLGTVADLDPQKSERELVTVRVAKHGPPAVRGAARLASYWSIEISSTVKMSVAPGGIDPCPFGP